MTQNSSQKLNILFGVLGDVTNLFFSLFGILFLPLSSTVTFSLCFSDPKVLFILLSNFISLCAFILIIVIEIKREIWLIDHFDYSKRYSSVHLATYKQQYPLIFERLSELNLKYYMVYRICSVIYLLNFLTTSAILLIYFYNDYKTVTGMFTNFWFCNSKLLKGKSIAKESFENNIGHSYYNTLSLSFNRIDPKFKRHDSTSNPDSLNASLRGTFTELEETHL